MFPPAESQFEFLPAIVHYEGPGSILAHNHLGYPHPNYLHLTPVTLPLGWDVEQITFFPVFGNLKLNFEFYKLPIL